MTAAVAVRDTISSPRATASAVAKAIRIIMMEPVMHAGMGIRRSRQATASAVPKAIRIIITASATSAVRPACTTVIPVTVVRGILPSIIMEHVMHAVRGLDNTRQATASAVLKAIRIITTANAMHRQSP